VTDEELRAWAATQGETGADVLRVLSERNDLRKALALRFEARRDGHDRLAKEAYARAVEASEKGDEAAEREAAAQVRCSYAVAHAFDEAASMARETAAAGVLAERDRQAKRSIDRVGPTTNLHWLPFDKDDSGTWVLSADGPGRDTVYVDLRSTGLVQITIDNGSRSMSAMLTAGHWAGLRALRRRDGERR
jgi:hypothetical protein